MPDPSRDASLAGIAIVVTAVLSGAVGLGVGALVGVPALLGIVGLFVGFALGFRLVYSRYRDI